MTSYILFISSSIYSFRYSFIIILCFSYLYNYLVYKYVNYYYYLNLGFFST